MDKKLNFDDKDILNDAFLSHQILTEQYNLYAGESSTTAFRNELLDILNEEHKILGEVLQEMTKRGWSETKQAEQQTINDIKSKFERL